ncbi:hypothetical protein M433DRAFT_59753 [Acidomyces richmondensis BFW]|nr:MAG: hypothetical protein FE78DRAFT_156031 [Acidomyces sp. 'richmondensis']KYG49096.1 hypothetical protein M433DRAFT_59753 [Acidomyces richmondensis BFW]
MDVHRSRFVPYPVSAITALSFSRSSDTGYTGPLPALKLAIGRANGNVEIWNPGKGVWVQEATFLGDGKGIEGLVWTQDPDESMLDGSLLPGQQRLFSISSEPTVAEWELGTGQVKRRSTGNFGEVWCIAAQPRGRRSNAKDEEPMAQDIAAGCRDGTIVLLSTAEGDLQFKRFLARVSGKKARCMSMTYQNRNIVVAGFVDGMIRVYDTRNGSQIRQMSLGTSLPGAGKNAIVWQVRSLPNGDILSGDSNGEVRIWDGQNYSLLRRLTGHESDCLDLVCSADGKTLFSGGIDGKMAVYKQTNHASRSSWAKISHRRLHNDEVKALASFDSKLGLSVVVSGGSDVTPIITPLREHGKEEIRRLPSLPQDCPVASAPKARLLISWWERDVYVWRISPQSGREVGPEPSKARKLVAKLSLTDGSDSIRTASISADGKMLATGTNSKIKIFQLKKRAGHDSLAVRRLDLPKAFTNLGARIVCFSYDGKWLAAVTPDSEVHIARLTSDVSHSKRMVCLAETVELERRHQNVQRSAFRAFERSITRITWAWDSSILVAADLAGYLDSWVLEGHEDSTAPAMAKIKRDMEKGSTVADSSSDGDGDSDSDDDDDEVIIYYGQHWADNPQGHLLPKLDAVPLVLTFRPSQPDAGQGGSANGNPGVHATRRNPNAHSHQLPSGDHHLLVLTARHHLYEFDILAGRLTDWSRRTLSPAALPEDFTKIKDRAMNAVWDGQGRLWLYGPTWVFMLDVRSDLVEGATSAQQHGKKRRRKRRAKRMTGSGAGDRIREQDPPVKRFERGRWKEEVANEKPLRRDLEMADEDDWEVQRLTVLASDGDPGDDVSGKQSSALTSTRKKWWCTFRYRPILGMVPLESEDAAAHEGRPLEVVLVERPI